MNKFVIAGGKPLNGKRKIHGAKNSALPLLSGALLSDEGEVVLRDIPDLRDVRVMFDIIKALGGSIKFSLDEVIIAPHNITSGTIPKHLMKEMRSSIVLLGAIINKLGWAKVFPPGGCAIGERPIDLHLSGLEQMGCRIAIDQESILITAPHGLKGATINLKYPSVGATENIMMAASKADGITEICNAAKEPEIVDLANFINSMGGQIKGAGSDKITIIGRKRFKSTDYRIIPDRIVAGTYMLAGAITGGEITLTNIVPEHIKAVANILEQSGVQIVMGEKKVTISAKNRNLVVPEIIETQPYPGFPTDMQAQVMALCCLIEGETRIIENVFEGRFKHVLELKKMGANIEIDENKAAVGRDSRLNGTVVKASDLRAGAALAIAGLGSDGITVIEDIDHIERGYQSFDGDLRALGAKIVRLPNNPKQDQIISNGNVY